MTEGFLERMAAASRRRAQAARARFPWSELEANAASAPTPVPLRAGGGFELIAEIKLRSPAEGEFGSGSASAPETLVARARAYEAGGAAALSVLTEPEAFRGALEHLATVAAGSRLPVMRKDFLVDEYQVLEARAQGASGVLLIARILDDSRLDRLLALTRELGMFALLEAFDDRDLDRLSRALRERPVTGGPAVLVGVNCRDLRTLQVDPSRFGELVGRAPEGVPLVAESGVLTPADAARVASLGYGWALVGSALMRSDDPGRTIADMLTSGREVRS